MTTPAYDSRAQMEVVATICGAEMITRAIAGRVQVYIIITVGASRFKMFDNLIRRSGIEWKNVTGFHLDKNADLLMAHPAPFRFCLWGGVLSRIALLLETHRYITAELSIESECKCPSRLIHWYATNAVFVALCNHRLLADTDRCVVLTAAITPAEMGPGAYKLGSPRPKVNPNTVAHTSDGGRLLRAGILILRCARNLKPHFRCNHIGVDCPTVTDPRHTAGFTFTVPSELHGLPQ